MTDETVFVVVPYPTDEQRRALIRRGEARVLNAATYDPKTRTYTVTDIALAAAGVEATNG